MRVAQRDVFIFFKVMLKISLIRERERKRESKRLRLCLI